MKNKFWYIISNLNTISRLAVLENAYDSQRYIDELIQIIRYCECEANEMSTIEKELDIINKMFDFYQVQKGKRFKGIVLNTIKDRKVYVPKGGLIFFVENGLEHAFLGNKEQLEMKIIVQQQKDTCDLFIQDNGIGFDVAMIDKDTERFKKYRDMRSYWQSFGEIEISSVKDIGTKIHLMLPLNV